MADNTTSTNTGGIVGETVDTVTNHMGASLLLFVAGIAVDRFFLSKKGN